ncbi:MAG: glycosyltransferase [Clostridiales bacterium]|uniref:MGDG synthase family glycosyltransferase n=1 Tax=Romboutsia timonensis TaxID=1776391 RepID=UPI0025DC5112|nr:glycosyltransferase [uncultured Intestinibacter sp.]MDU1204058.1 glycosyltransferase [Clostridiales bacterium]
MSKKVLIMSASTGGGHNRAAKAMKDEIEKKCIDGEHITCEIIDSLKLINTTMDKIISSGYEKSAKYTPKAWGGVYKMSDANIVSKHEYKGNLFNTLLASKLKKLLKERKPDLIIGTHPFPMIALSTLKKKYPYRNAFNSFFVPPLISVLTDYTAHSTYIQDEIDYYIAGDEYVKEVLISEGVDGDKIKPYGIPVEKSFLEHREKSVVLEELGLAPDKFTVLLMGGSFGAGNIKDTLKELLEIDRDFQIIVITGRNETLKEKLEKSLEKYTIDKNISILGFTQDMNDILSAVDIIVSKPGGLTTTECLLKELPMIIPYYIPGQEEENMDFLSNCGAALRTSKKFTISVLLKVLIDNPMRMELLKNNIKSVKKQNTAEDIANLVSNILGY